MTAAATAYVLLEDGRRFDGLACGADDLAVGEIVFTTSMSGYQEAMTDPSYAGQLIAFTYPQIGNYGVSSEAMESDRAHARAAIMRAAVNQRPASGGGEGEIARGWCEWLIDSGVPAITDLDTRALVRHIRARGAMRGGLFPARIPERQARELIDAEPVMAGRDLARDVTPAGTVTLEPTADGPGGERVRIAMLDTGVKRSIVRNLRERGAAVTLHPCTTSADALLADDPDAVFLANGPGDPAALDAVVATVRSVVGRLPVYGICLGHQLLCRAVGLQTYKLPF
ncbi:MAG: carbamoyl phosphate synthase small subunit, partial [Solirubrobacteraceae bacterium]